MKQPIKRTLFFLLIAATVLAACAPAPAPAPTQDPALIQQLIEQSVALTLAAQNAQATEQQALIVPSNTPLPTQTEPVPATPTSVVPTATPFVIVPPTNTAVVSGGGGGGGGGGSPAVQPDYACSVTARTPADYTVFKPGEDFDIKWTILNTGKKNIRDGADVKYSSGEDFAIQNFVELPLLKPGERHQVIVDAEAPSKLGRYIMVWVVEGQLCFPYVAIEVKN